MSESISERLRDYIWDCVDSGTLDNRIAIDLDSMTRAIDVRFSNEMETKQEDIEAIYVSKLSAKQDEIDNLQNYINATCCQRSFVDSKEKIDVDMCKTPCDYFEHEGKPCHTCMVYSIDAPCYQLQSFDIQRRQCKL